MVVQAFRWWGWKPACQHRCQTMQNQVPRMFELRFARMYFLKHYKVPWPPQNIWPNKHSFLRQTKTIQPNIQSGHWPTGTWVQCWFCWNSWVFTMEIQASLLWALLSILWLRTAACQLGLLILLNAREEVLLTGLQTTPAPWEAAPGWTWNIQKCCHLVAPSGRSKALPGQQRQ